MDKFFSIIIGGAALLAAGCVHENGGARPTLAVAALVTVTEDGSGGYYFSYDAPFADAAGNFDFSKGDAYGKVITITFSISDASASDARFKPVAADAIWIVDKKNVGADGSPTGPYEGRQFHDFASNSRLEFSVTDENNDGVLYRYSLRFDIDGATVVDDPDIGNGSGAGSGGHGR